MLIANGYVGKLVLITYNKLDTNELIIKDE